MEHSEFSSLRTRIAHRIFKALESDMPDGVVEVHSPDGIGATGLKLADGGYILVQVEDAS